LLYDSRVEVSVSLELMRTYTISITSHPLGYDIGDLSVHSNAAVSPVLLNTILELEAKFSAQEVRDAKKAMTVNERLLHQSPTNFYNIVNGSETIQSPPIVFVSANAFTDHLFQVTNLVLFGTSPSVLSLVVQSIFRDLFTLSTKTSQSVLIFVCEQMLSLQMHLPTPTASFYFFSHKSSTRTTIFFLYTNPQHLSFSWFPHHSSECRQRL